ncbi:MAG: FKBP-type peptidyl-prolyl cis-trans isomerase [Niabella sp.]|nr:FKBP-type peptidyl-prolyl cis-trans isomerase [Niabella sp.]
MKKKFLVPLFAVAAAVVTLASCMKSNQSTACTNGLTLTQDKAAIDSFLRNNGQSAQYQFDDQASAYYAILNPGSGANKPTADSLVSFHFETRLLNGTLVDSGSTQAGTPAYKLSQYASYGRPLGVQYALAMITKGGSVSLIVPSSVAYGCNTVTFANPIPANSQLIYNFQLLDMAPSSY